MALLESELLEQANAVPGVCDGLPFDAAGQGAVDPSHDRSGADSAQILFQSTGFSVTQQQELAGVRDFCDDLEPRQSSVVCTEPGQIPYDCNLVAWAKSKPSEFP